MRATMGKKGSGVVILMVLFLIGLAGPGQAAIPRTLNFQGYLTNPAGNLINGTVAKTFSIYAQESGGTALWTESHPDVVLLSGVYKFYWVRQLPWVYFSMAPTIWGSRWRTIRR